MNISSRLNKVWEDFRFLFGKVFLLTFFIIFSNHNARSQNLYVNNTPKKELSKVELKFISLIDSLFEYKTVVIDITSGKPSRFDRKNAGFKKNRSNPTNYVLVRVYYIDEIKKRYGYHEYQYVYDSINAKVRWDHKHGFGNINRGILFPFNQYKSELDIIDESHKSEGFKSSWCCGKDDWRWWNLNEFDFARIELKIYKEMHLTLSSLNN